MTRYRVKNAFRNPFNGEVIEAGADFPDGLDESQIKRLIAAECLEEVSPAEARAAGDDGDQAAGGKGRAKR
jgi:hypothetical protein